MKRDPLRFEAFDLFSIFSRDEAISLRDGKAIESFRKRVDAEIGSGISNPAFLHGHLAESIFLQLVVSLDVVKLITQEDAGEIYCQDDTMRVPDFRLIVADDKPPLLIEVKNFRQGSGTEAYELGERYVQGLEAYARLARCDLAVAIYWVGWNQWTLIPTTAFKKGEGKRFITLAEAFPPNQMAILGDKMIATRFPLRVVVRADKSKPRSLSDGRVQFTIGGVELFSQEDRILDSIDANIALFLCLWGKWKEESEAIVDGDKLDAVQHRFNPTEPHDSNEFSIVGSLSSMFSKQYQARAVDNDGNIRQIRLDFPPGHLAKLLPGQYTGRELPLWVFIQEPSNGAPET